MSARHYTLWADQRLSQAYDLVSEVLSQHGTDDDKLPEIVDLLTEIDNADQLLAGALHDRRQS